MRPLFQRSDPGPCAGDGVRYQRLGWTRACDGANERVTDRVNRGVPVAFLPF